jgi:hypothetical protein
VRAGYGCAGDGLHDNVAEGKTNKAEIQCLKKISATGKSRKRISPDLPSRRMRIAKEPQSKVVVSPEDFLHPAKSLDVKFYGFSSRV